MKRSPNPTVKALITAYNQMGQQDQNDFLRAMEENMFKLHVSYVCKTSEDREILLTFVPKYKDVRNMLSTPFSNVLRTVREAQKMAAYMIVTRPPCPDFRLALFFEEDPSLYDTLFQQEYENDSKSVLGGLHEFEFSRVILLGDDPIQTLGEVGIPITSWVRYQEDGHKWSWNNF
jgi:hypothetical protein